MEEKDAECKMADYVDVPKTLGDVFEALIGGIFLDCGNDLEVRSEMHFIHSKQLTFLISDYMESSLQIDGKGNT